MPFISQYQYYENGGNTPEDANWGSYQYVSLEDIVKTFQLTNTGDSSYVKNEPRHKIIHFAKEAIRELNYDAFKEIKALELKVCDQLRYILPSDYVNFVRISMYKDGVLIPLEENDQAMTSKAYLQDKDCQIVFDENNEIIGAESKLDLDRITGQNKQIYTNPGAYYDGYYGWNYEGNWYFGGAFGLDPSKMSVAPKYRIDKRGGVINFNSEMAGELIVLEYVSDGMENGDESMIAVNKLFEKHVYAYITYALMENKIGVPEYVVRRFKKKSWAELQNAKIRMGDFDPGKLLMAMRGQGKPIK